MAQTKGNSLKYRITKLVLNEIPAHKKPPILCDRLLDEIVFYFWMTGRNDGLRLTDIGRSAFMLADIEGFTFDLSTKKQSHHATMLELIKKIKCPYYLPRPTKETSKIEIFDSKIAMMIGLYGSLKDYLESVK